jgi:site-specific DNA-methyltransferase (adenine-specific)
VKPYFQDEAVTIYHGDCREVLPALTPVDHVITDPPYAEYVHAKARTNPGYDKAAIHMPACRYLNFDSLEDDVRSVIGALIIPMASRWTLVFSDLESTEKWRVALASLDYVRTGIWHKLNGAPQFTGDRPAVGCEAITICHAKSRKRWNGGGHQAFWEHPISHAMDRFHTAMKPLSLMAQIVGLFTDPGETILDPFMGSGTTLRAAKDLGRKAIGIEIEERYCEIAAKRMSQSVIQFGKI